MYVCVCACVYVYVCVFTQCFTLTVTVLSYHLAQIITDNTDSSVTSYKSCMCRNCYNNYQMSSGNYLKE